LKQVVISSRNSFSSDEVLRLILRPIFVGFGLEGFMSWSQRLQVLV